MILYGFIFAILLIVDYYTNGSFIGTFLRIPKYSFILVGIIIFIQNIKDGTETRDGFFDYMRKIKGKKYNI
tara:strand:- start:13860 stop:14072 length:213 start_codon:yes stop_codon:yes gene_type:complete